MKETGVKTTTSKKLFVERPDDRLFSVHKIFAMGVKEETMPRCYFPFTFLFIIAPAVAIRSIARFVLAPPILSRTTFRLYELALKPISPYDKLSDKDWGFQRSINETLYVTLSM